jgi:ABC-type glycerol-3-phosphate transport system substrate-binding protein
MRHWNQIASLVIAASLIGACAPQTPAAATTQPTIPATATITATAAPTQAPTTIGWHSFFGGPRHSAWDLALTEQLPTGQVPIFLRLSATALYAEPVPLDELEGVFSAQPVPEAISGFIAGSALNKHARAGELAPLDEVWQGEGWEEVFPESVIDMATVDGTRYYLPQAVQWNPVWYRTDVFEQLGLEPPQTWDEVKTLCADLQAEGIIPFTVSELGWRPPLARWFTILNLRLNGADFHQQLMAGEIPFDDSRVRAVFEHWLELYDAGCFEDPANNVNYGRAIDRFSAGDAAMYNLGEWIYESLDPEVEQNIDFFRFPTLDPSVPNGEIASVYGSYLTADSAEPEAALEFIRFLGSVDTQQSIVEEVGRLVPDRRIDPSLVPDYQQKGLEFLEGSSQLVTLFEFNCFSEDMAKAGLDAFAEFYDLRAEDAIDPILAELETVRQEQLADS